VNKSLYTLATLIVVLAGCSTDSQIYRDQPLVANVEAGMSKEQVEQIGGPPLSISNRTVEPGTCFDYNLTQPGHQQRYNVSFDSRGRVDHKSFMTCAEWSNAQQKAREPTRSGGGGY
jgi:osmotically inducible lipoprotein OsmE